MLSLNSVHKAKKPARTASPLWTGKPSYSKVLQKAPMVHNSAWENQMQWVINWNLCLLCQPLRDCAFQDFTDLQLKNNCNNSTWTISSDVIIGVQIQSSFMKGNVCVSCFMFKNYLEFVRVWWKIVCIMRIVCHLY